MAGPRERGNSPAAGTGARRLPEWRTRCALRRWGAPELAPDHLPHPQYLVQYCAAPRNVASRRPRSPVQPTEDLSAVLYACYIHHVPSTFTCRSIDEQGDYPPVILFCSTPLPIIRGRRRGRKHRQDVRGSEVAQVRPRPRALQGKHPKHSTYTCRPVDEQGVVRFNRAHAVDRVRCRSCPGQVPTGILRRVPPSATAAGPLSAALDGQARLPPVPRARREGTAAAGRAEPSRAETPVETARLSRGGAAGSRGVGPKNHGRASGGWGGGVR